MADLQLLWEAVIAQINPEKVLKSDKNFRQGGNKFPALYKTTKQDHCISVNNSASGDTPSPHESAAWGGTPHAMLSPPIERQADKRPASSVPLRIGEVCQQPEVMMVRPPSKAEIRQSALLCHELGIHQSAVDDAVEVFGVINTMQLIRQISSKRCPGGYLRYLTRNPRNAHAYLARN